MSQRHSQSLNSPDARFSVKRQQDGSYGIYFGENLQMTEKKEQEAYARVVRLNKLLDAAQNNKPSSP